MKEIILTLQVKSYIVECARCGTEAPVRFSEIKRKAPDGFTSTVNPEAPLEVAYFMRPDNWTSVRSLDGSCDYDICQSCTLHLQTLTLSAIQDKDSEKLTPKDTPPYDNEIADRVRHRCPHKTALGKQCILVYLHDFSQHVDIDENYFSS